VDFVAGVGFRFFCMWISTFSRTARNAFMPVGKCLVITGKKYNIIVVVVTLQVCKARLLLSSQE